MRAKLTHDGQWVDVKDDDGEIQITTPNGHLYRTSSMECLKPNECSLNWHTFTSFCEATNVPANDQAILMKLYPFTGYHVFDRYATTGYFYSCFVSDRLRFTAGAGAVHVLSNVIIYLNVTLINKVLEFDRECERTKALQSIGNFCARMGGMKELLEFTQGVVNIVTEKQEKGPEKNKPPSLVL